MKKVILAIDGMTCAACSSGLEKFLNKQDGVKSASVNLIMNNASIEYDEKLLTLEDLNKFVEKAGFKSLGIDNFDKEVKKDKNKKPILIALIFIAILSMSLTMSHMALFNLLDGEVYKVIYCLLLMIFAISSMLLSFNILKNGFKNLIHLTPNMDSLVFLGVISSFVYSIFGFVMIIKGNDLFLDRLYFDAVPMVLCFINVGKYIENINKNKTREALQKLMTITPKFATVIVDSEEKKVTIDEIKPGDIVVCKPGEKIAVDGVVVEGKAHIDESFITGESMPVKREKDSNVIAGSLNIDGTIQYKAVRIGKESTVSEIVREVNQMTTTKAPIARIADKVSGVFVPVIIVIAVLSFAFWMFKTWDFSTSFNVFASVLLVACPCSLGLATPLAIVISSGVCTNKGILVKSSESLENAHKIKTLIFDKTGTLTKGVLSINNFFNYSNIANDELLKNISSIESKSTHPISQAIVKYAKEKKIYPIKVTDFNSISGYGVFGKIDNDEYHIGNKDLMVNNNIGINEDDEKTITNTGSSIVYVAKNKELVAMIGLKDVIKDNCKDVLSNLNNKNINTIMLTGDNEKTAKYIAEEIGVTKFTANVKPKEKADFVEKQKEEGMVAFVGDGINDSIALVASDIGISISNGTDIAKDSASVVLMNGDLERIIDLINISKVTIRNIKQNLFWAFFYNMLMIPVAMGALSTFGLSLNPMIASLAMTLSSLTVVLNALRLKRIK